MVTFTFTMRRHLTRLSSAPFISSHLATSGWVRFPCARRGKHNAEFTKVNEKYDPILSCLWKKFTSFSDDVRRPLHFPTPFFDCLYHASFRRYSPLSLEVVKKRSKCKSFVDPNFCRRNGSDFSMAVC